MQYVRYPKFKHSKKDTNQKIISQVDLEEILERFPEGTPHYIPIVIGYHTGCRIGEVMGLTWNDVDLKEGTIDINKIISNKGNEWCFADPKTPTSVRRIKIGQTLVSILKKHKVAQKENRLKYGQHYSQAYEKKVESVHGAFRSIIEMPLKIDVGLMQPINMVCTKENGEIVTPNTMKYASRVINQILNIQFNFHSLRHTHATMLIENGAKIKDVQVRLGHKNIETTLNRYTHGTEIMAEESVKIFEESISKK